MKTEALNGVVNGILWNAWTELGVPGVERAHRRVAVDPDPLIVFTAALATDDPRLLEQVSLWCERFGSVIATTRLWGLAKRSPDEIGSAFEKFVGALSGSASRWRRSCGDKSRGPSQRSDFPPLDRPALVRLRMRALAGTGVRADVLCELLAAPAAWSSATDLERLGYARRSLARVLDELAAAGIVIERPRKGPKAFRLRDSESLAKQVEAGALHWVDWCALLTFAWHLLTLQKLEDKASMLFQIKAFEAQQKLMSLARAAGLPEPPITASAKAWPHLSDWGIATLHDWLHVTTSAERAASSQR